MNELQKVIKYGAMAFAGFLAFMIISGITSTVFTVANILDKSSSASTSDNSYDKSFQNIKSLSTENGIGELIIKLTQEDEFRVVGENVPKSFKAEKTNNGELKIINDYKSWSIFGNRFGQGAKITVYLPYGFVANYVKIKAGAGDISINELKTERLEIKAGVGEISGTNIKADKVNFKGGVGDATFKEVDFTDLDIDNGVGDITLEGVVKGNSKIQCGIGNVDLVLKGSSDDYNLKVDKGLGSISINGSKYTSLKWNNTIADNTLKVKGGVGDIDIEFKK